MKISNQLIELYTELCANYSPDAVAVDQYDNKCFPWEPCAVAWDTHGLLEKHFYNIETNKYNKSYDPIQKILAESLGGIKDQLDDHPDPHMQVHARWWGAILAALADERKQKL